MIVFKLTMPKSGSWNGKWSGEGKLYTLSKQNKQVPKKCWGKTYMYNWSDGWTVRVDAIWMPFHEAEKYTRKSEGFQGYDWMVDSIIKYNEIREPQINEQEVMVE